MDYLPAPRSSNSNAFAVVAAACIALAAGPATIYGAVIGLALHDDLRDSYDIPGSYKVFGVPSGLVAFLVGAAVTVGILAVLFVLAVRSGRPATQTAPRSATTGYPQPTPPTRAANLAIGLSFVVGVVGVAVLLVVAVVVFFLIALSQANLPM